MKEIFLNTYTAVLIKEDDLYLAYAEELPGSNTQGKTLEEAKENLKEAIEMVIEANKKLSRKAINRKKYLKEKIFVSI
ncbi:MAG: type II toxin-antitoxin system HicB family antitoxin [Ignavibacteria bacterium]